MAEKEFFFSRHPFFFPCEGAWIRVPRGLAQLRGIQQNQLHESGVQYDHILSPNP